jgi:hypothetical protein
VGRYLRHGEEGSLALTYFLTGNPQYHRREGVSRSCSGREGVVPPCYGHQTKLVAVGDGVMPDANGAESEEVVIIESLGGDCCFVVLPWSGDMYP